VTASVPRRIKQTGRAGLNRSRRTLRELRHVHRDDFVFIHINKTGGTSVRRALSLNVEHRTALGKIEQFGQREWDRRFTFAVVRNPWSKVLSHWNYRRKKDITGLGVAPLDFNNWVQRAYGLQDPLFYDKPKMFMPQSQWICDSDGRVLVDSVARFEELEHDFSVACKSIGTSVTLPHMNASFSNTCSEMYNSESIEIVETWFAEDIDRFSYEFPAG